MEDRADISGLLLHNSGAHEWVFRADEARRSNAGFAVRSIPGKGHGAFALRDFAIGDLIMLEKPLVTWPAAAGEMTKGKLPDVLAAEMTRLGAQVRATFESLSQAEIHGAGQGLKTLSGIWLTNAIPSSEEDGTASVYADACRLNHSCIPNVHHSIDRPDKAAHLRAMVKIRKGDELLLSYIDADNMTSEQRASKLSRVFGFHCSCVACSLTDGELARSDTRRRRMYELRERLQSQAGCADAAEVVRCVDERLAALRREGVPFVHGQEDMMIAMEACRSSGDLRAASRWALRAAECVRIGAGESNPIHSQLKQLAEMMMVQSGVDPRRFEF